MADGTIFDSVFRTIVQKAPELVIPLINEAFGRDYPEDEPFDQLRNEHEEPGGRIVTDSVFRIAGRVYHVECQSTRDSTMAVRMIEYDFAIALEQAVEGGAPYELRFPESCVLYLRHTAATPDRIGMRVVLPSGDSFGYHVPVVKAQAYSGDEIFAKGLLMLLPFYIMRYEGRLPEIARSEELSARLVAECSALRGRLERETVWRDRAELYDRIVELAVRVSDHVLGAQERLRREVRAAMGGEILELMSDKIAAAEKEAAARAYERGLSQGMEEGIEQGMQQGMQQGIERMAESLRSAGVDEAAIAAAVEASSSSGGKRGD